MQPRSRIAQARERVAALFPRKWSCPPNARLHSSKNPWHIHGFVHTRVYGDESLTGTFDAVCDSGCAIADGRIVHHDCGSARTRSMAALAPSALGYPGNQSDVSGKIERHGNSSDWTGNEPGD